MRIQNEQSSLTARDNGIISNNDENYLLRLGHIVALRIEAAEHGHYQ